MTRRRDAAVTLDDARALACFTAGLAEWAEVDPTTLADTALELCLQYRRCNLDNEETVRALGNLGLTGDAIALVGAEPAVSGPMGHDVIPLLRSLPADLLLNEEEG